MELKELDKKEMGRKLRKRREMLHISRDDLGKSLGVTGKFISDVEYGDKGLSIKNLYKVKQILNLSTDYLLDSSPAPSEEKQMQLDQIAGILQTCEMEDLKRIENIITLYIQGTMKK